MAVVTVASFFLMVYIDHITGFELVFSGAYLIPALLAAWYFGWGAVLGVALASGASTWILDSLEGHIYSHFMIQYWNALTCVLVTAIAGLTLDRLRTTLAERERMNEELQRTVASLRASTGEIRKLQNGLQTVCAWTNKIKVGEQWMSPDEFLESKLQIKITHGMSPEVVKEFEEATRPEEVEPEG